MMFFEVHGALLRRAAEALQQGVLPRLTHDADARDTVMQAAQLVGETGFLWADLFATLEQENSLLKVALERAGATPESLCESDPLARHAQLVRGLSSAVEVLHERGDAKALEDVRSAMSSAAALETRVMRSARTRWAATTGHVCEPEPTEVST